MIEFYGTGFMDMNCVLTVENFPERMIFLQALYNYVAKLFSVGSEIKTVGRYYNGRRNLNTVM